MKIDLSPVTEPRMREFVSLAFVHLPLLDEELHNVWRLVDNMGVAVIDVSPPVAYAILYGLQAMRELAPAHATEQDLADIETVADTITSLLVLNRRA